MSQPTIYIAVQRLENTKDREILLSISAWPLHFQVTLPLDQAHRLSDELASLLIKISRLDEPLKV